MRIFLNCKEAVKEVERDLVEMGVHNHPETMQDKIIEDNPDFDTLEVMGYSYCIKDFKDKDFILEYLKIPKNYCEQEYKDRANSDILNPGESWKLRKEIWEEFLHDGKFAYTYNERFRLENRLEKLMYQLKNYPSTRQGILAIFDPCRDYDNMGGQSRVPCSMYYQFYIRNKKLNMIYTMRSCDFKTHFGADVWLAIRLLEDIADFLSIETGDFIHFLGSLHIYKRDAGGIF